jgi:XTP/dITP diphosphohydrolase
MRELLIATMNTGKVKEMRVLLEGLPFTVIGLDEVDITTDVEEPAQTFEGNAIIKAISYGNLSHTLTLSEDSGLEIDALHGEPGVYTKRYTAGTDDNGHVKIFDAMKDVADADRGAQFHSVIALYDPIHNKIRTCEGIARGVITREARGTNGFGQDPIFLYEGSTKTGGEMSTEEKNAISHRSKAIVKAREILLSEFV